MSEGKIYLGFDGSGLFKIGITGDDKKRLSQFRTANPTFQYLFVFTVKNPAIVELTLHTRFIDSCISGEWFDLNAKDLKWIYDEFMGEYSIHSLEDFEIVIYMIRDKKIANDFSLIKQINKTCELLVGRHGNERI